MYAAGKIDNHKESTNWPLRDVAIIFKVEISNPTESLIAFVISIAPAWLPRDSVNNANIG